MLMSCRTTEPASIQLTNPLTPPQASLVSLQPTSETEAELILKVTQGLAVDGWQLAVRRSDGQSVPVSPGSGVVVGPFTLLPLRLSPLTTNSRYTVELRFRFNNQDSVTALRTYVHRLGGPRWQRLAHAPLDGGEYTAYPVADQYTNLLLGRYAGRDQMQAWQYAAPYDRWYQTQTSLLKIPARQGLIQFNLGYVTDVHYFYGLGYTLTDQVSSPYYFYNDLWTIFGTYDGPVVPGYQGEPGEVAFFITRDSLTATESAFFLTQNGSPTLRTLGVFLGQGTRAPLPEAPATLATFTAHNMGYVVNQLAGQPPHLWAYDPVGDRWQRRADFPGVQRIQGLGFALKGNGYFGLGTRPSDGLGLRDLWQYDPLADRWQYVTEYPGQANRYLAVVSTAERAYLGWGYESQSTPSGVIRQVPCTDWWSFQP